MRFNDYEHEITQVKNVISRFEDGIEYKTLCEEIARMLGCRIDIAAQFVTYSIYHGLVWIDTFSTIDLSANTLIRPVTRYTTCFRSIFDEIKPYTVYDLISNGGISKSIEVSDKVKERKYPEIPMKYESVVAQREAIVKEWTSIPPSQRNEDWRRVFTKRVKTSCRTIESWVKRYERFGIEGLVPKFSEAGRKKSILPDVMALMEEYRQKYLKDRFSTIKGIYSKFSDACDDQRLNPPSYPTFQRFVKELPQSKLIKAKMGRSVWRNTFRPSLDVFKDAIMPFQVLEADNWPFDVFPVDTETRESIKTPSLVAAIDVYTRMVTGYYLTFDHPSKLTVLEVLVMSMLPKDKKTDWRNTSNKWPIEGIPVMALVDNGLDYRAEDVKSFCMEYGIILEYAPVKQPESKAYIEQWFEILKKDLKNENVSGFRPAMKLRKSMDDFNPEEQAAMTLYEIERWLVSWIVDTYHERTQQKEHLPSPLMLLDDTMKGHTPLPLPAPITFTKEHRDKLEYQALNRLKATLNNKGITKSYIQYNSLDLQVLFKQKGSIEVEYRFDPRDIREIFVIHPDDGKIIIARPASGWGRVLIETHGDNPISASEWKSMLRQARERNRARVSPVTLKRAELERRREIRSASDMTSEKRRKSKQELLNAEIKREHAKTALSARKRRDKADTTTPSTNMNDTSITMLENEKQVLDVESKDDKYVPTKLTSNIGRSEKNTEDDYKPTKNSFELLKKKGEPIDRQEK
nr:DDE-type integrase/transposase/recombinase [Candidatus Sigynarchaeota archaeon]